MFNQRSKYGATKYIYDVPTDSFFKVKKGDTKTYKKQLDSGEMFLFDSKSEMNFYFILRDKENRGLIKNLVLQPEYIVIEKFTDKHSGKKYRCMKYRADFEYLTLRGTIKTIDVKGFVIPEANIKRKLFTLTHQDTHELVWVKYDAKNKEFVEYDELEKIIRKRKKEKKEREAKDAAN